MVFVDTYTKRDICVLQERQLIEQRIHTALNATPARIPVIIGGCGAGRLRALASPHQLRAGRRDVAGLCAAPRRS